jgi:aspartate/methionine/tyrosine aminotransferase
MPKASKSSASAGTRKKHAKKAGKEGPDPASTQQPMKQRGEKKLSKAQRKALPKVKQYIPPPKPPAPPIPDPLDGQGLAKTLPAELVVVLRRLGKKDEVTRRKGLEELREGWVQRLEEGDEVERELRENTLLSAVPVWVSVAMHIIGQEADEVVVPQPGQSAAITLSPISRSPAARRAPLYPFRSQRNRRHLVTRTLTRNTEPRCAGIMDGRGS